MSRRSIVREKLFNQSCSGVNGPWPRAVRKNCFLSSTRDDPAETDSGCCLKRQQSISTNETLGRSLDTVRVDRLPQARARTDRAWSAAATPVIQPPCAVEKSCGEHASPAKNSRSSTGARSFKRQFAMPGRAYEYEPREYGSDLQRWIRMGLTRLLNALPSRQVSWESEKSKNAS